MIFRNLLGSSSSWSLQASLPVFLVHESISKSMLPSHQFLPLSLCRTDTVSLVGNVGLQVGSRHWRPVLRHFIPNSFFFVALPDYFLPLLSECKASSTIVPFHVIYHLRWYVAHSLRRERNGNGHMCMTSAISIRKGIAVATYSVERRAVEALPCIARAVLKTQTIMLLDSYASWLKIEPFHPRSFL